MTERWWSTWSHTHLAVSLWFNMIRFSGVWLIYVRIEICCEFDYLSCIKKLFRAQSMLRYCAFDRWMGTGQASVSVHASSWKHFFLTSAGRCNIIALALCFYNFSCSALVNHLTWNYRRRFFFAKIINLCSYFSLRCVTPSGRLKVFINILLFAWKKISFEMINWWT